MRKTVTLMFLVLAAPAAAQFAPGTVPTMSTNAPALRVAMRPVATLPADRVKIFMKLTGTAIAPPQGQPARLSPARLTDGAAWLLIEGGDVAGNYNGQFPDGVALIHTNSGGGVRLTLAASSKPYLVDCTVDGTQRLEYSSSVSSANSPGTGMLPVTAGHVFLAINPAPTPPSLYLREPSGAQWNFLGCEVTPMG